MPRPASTSLKMSLKYFFKIIIVVETVASFVNGANILAFLPVPARSHMYVFRPLLEELSSRNHTITAIVAVPQKILSSNYKEIVVESSTLIKLKNHDFFPEDEEVQSFTKNEVLHYGYMICEDGFRNTEFQKLVQSSNDVKFDVILIEFFYQFSSAALGYVFNAPIISLNSHGYTNMDEEFSGDPSYLPYVPDLYLPYGNEMTFLQRLHNFGFKLQSNMYNYRYNLPQHEELLKTYFKNHYPGMPPLTEMLKNVSLNIINSHPCINPRPYNPNTIEVAGIHISENKMEKLPQDLKSFLDDAPEGVIYLSFGSNIPMNKMPKRRLQPFLDVFSNIKQKVLWKVELDNTDELPKNILIKNWVPQKSVLAHKNCLIFISHGGLLSIEEAIWFGVPILGIPFFGDQPMNLERVHQAGFGIRIEYKNISSRSISWAINEILNVPSYRETIKKYSKVFSDYPLSPLAKAVYWAEFVIRHKGTPYYRPVGNSMLWYQFYSLDIYLCVVFVFMFFLFLIYISVKFFICIFLTNLCNVSNDSKKVKCQ